MAKQVLLLEGDENINIANLEIYAGGETIVSKNGDLFLVAVKRLNQKHAVEAPVDVKLPKLPDELLECDECGYTNVDAKAMGGHKAGHTKAQQRMDRLHGKKKRKAKR